MDNRARSMAASTTKRSRSNSNSRSSSLESKARSRSSILALVGGPKKGTDFKLEKTKNLTYLIKFLEETEYRPISIMSPKELQCPTKTRFLGIYSHLMQIICSSYNLTDKPEETIPQELKSVGYPHQISKSSIQSIAPHTWPQLLAALVFHCRAIESVQDFPNVYEQDDYLMDQCKIMTGGIETSVEDLVEDVWKSLVPLKNDKQEKNQKLDGVRAQVEEEKRVIQDMYKSLENLESSEKTYDAFSTNMLQYLENLYNENRKLESDISALEILSHEKIEQCHELEKLCAQQTISAEEMERRCEEVQQLQSELDRLTAHLEQKRSEVQKNQLDLANVKSEVKKGVEEMNRLLIQLSNSENQVMQLEYGGKVTLKKQYLRHIQPLVNFWRNKLANPDQLAERIKEFQKEVDKYTLMKSDKQAELKSAEKKLDELYLSSTAELKTSYDRLQRTMERWQTFEVDYFKRKEKQMVELATVKYEVEFLAEEIERQRRMKEQAENILELTGKAEKLRQFQIAT